MKIATHTLTDCSMESCNIIITKVRQALRLIALHACVKIFFVKAGRNFWEKNLQGQVEDVARYDGLKTSALTLEPLAPAALKLSCCLLQVRIQTRNMFVT